MVSKVDSIEILILKLILKSFTTTTIKFVQIFIFIFKKIEKNLIYRSSHSNYWNEKELKKNANFLK